MKSVVTKTAGPSTGPRTPSTRGAQLVQQARPLPVSIRAIPREAAKPSAEKPKVEFSRPKPSFPSSPITVPAKIVEAEDVPAEEPAQKVRVAVDDDAPYVAPTEESAPTEIPIETEAAKPIAVSALTEKSLFSSSHVANGILNTIAIVESKVGYIPVVSRIKLPADSRLHGDSDVLMNAFERASSVIERKGIVAEQKEAARSLVNRARLGDQNAMAIIARVRQQAKIGNPLARNAYKHLKDYIDVTPTHAIFGADIDTLAKKDPKYWGRVWFANGNPITETEIEEIAVAFPINHKNAFLAGVEHWKEVERKDRRYVSSNPIAQSLLNIGAMVGSARALQMLRMPNSRITDYHEVAGWELGE